MTKRQLYRMLERAPAHRIPRCKRCRLVLPCRNDGTYGPCDARVASPEAITAACALLRAVFSEPGEYDTSDGDRDDRNERLAAARTASSAVRRGRCNRGHEQTPENIYEGIRNGKLRVWCAVCQKEQYARKHAQGNEKEARDDRGLGTSTDGVPDCTV